MEIITKLMVIDSGKSLKDYLEKSGLYISNVSGLEGSQNCIYLPDKTSFNWKSRAGVRVNCKNEAKMVIEQKTRFNVGDNYSSDPTREFSIVIDNEGDLEAVVEALKSIEGNASSIVIPENLPEGILLRRTDLADGIKGVLKSIPVTVSTDARNVLVRFQELLICGISIEEESYKLFNASSEWADKTTYLCEEAGDGTWFYYLETIDECIGETQRLVMFEAQKGKKKPEPISNGTHNSELSKIVNGNAFEKSFEAFIKQADANAISGKGAGGQTPFGFSGKPQCDGADVCTHYGQGGASKTPYLNWWVVSIYYIPDTGNITMGIEETRYPHLKEMAIKPLRYAQIGNKKEQIAVFYSTTKASVNYAELYENFLNVCEEVMRLGLR